MQESSVFDLIHDRDGLVWQVMLVRRLAPAQKRPDKIVWHVQMHAQSTVKGAHLVTTGTLDQAKDSRLLTLLGSEPVTLRAGAIRFEAVDEKQIPGSAVEAVSGLKNTLSSKGVTELKRQSVAQVVDRLCSFA
jgi:hypothetical protein